MDTKNEKMEKIQHWKGFWPAIQETTRETENHIDKKIYGISIGGIGVEVTSFQFLDDPSHIILACLSGLLFILTLFLNLYSHVRSLKSQEKEREAIRAFVQSKDVSDDSYIYDLIEDEYRLLTRINKASIWTMLLAIAALMAFVLLNI